MGKDWGIADVPSQAGKCAIVTGANRGLGLEIASVLATAGAEVVLACRNLDHGEAAAAAVRARAPGARVEARRVDVADLNSVRVFATHWGGRPLDLLVNNAAAILVPKGRTRDGFETHIGTNHLGHFALTGLLLPALLAAPAARVVNMSSLAHRLTPGIDLQDLDVERVPYKDMDAYGRSKLAALLFTFELDRRLRARRAPVLVAVAHPGYTATNLSLGNFFMRLSTRLFAQPTAMGALPALYAATAPGVEGGAFIGPGGFKELKGAPRPVEPRPEARDPALARGLWEASEKLTGVSWL